jgi:hypothetical protein
MMNDPKIKFTTTHRGTPERAASIREKATAITDADILDWFEQYKTRIVLSLDYEQMAYDDPAAGEIYYRGATIRELFANAMGGAVDARSPRKMIQDTIRNREEKARRS